MVILITVVVLTSTLLKICGLAPDSFDRFFRPEVQASVAAQQPAILEDNFFDSNGVRIRFVAQGPGTPIVLIHGYTGNIERHWINPGVFSKLATDFRVIALDCRGHGKSDKPVDPKRYGAEMSQDVVRLLDHLKIPRAHIVGYSMGAMIAGHVLTTNPDRFITATFVGYHPVHTWTAADEREAEASALDLESATPFRSLILGVSPPNAAPSEDEIREASRRLAAANDTKALAAYNRGRGALAVTDAQLAAIHVPTLGIIGSGDPSVGGMRDLQRVMSALTVVVVDGATHGGENGILRRPEFLVALREFLPRRH
jgi:pimeloyl-ACP methyl ester carboxylesterase